METKYPAIDFSHYHDEWCKTRTRDGGIGRACRRTVTLIQYAADMDIFFGYCSGNLERRNGNGHNGASRNARQDTPGAIAARGERSILRKGLNE